MREDIDAYMTRFVESDEHNVIETIIEFYNLQIKQSANINPLYFEELHRYPSVLAFFEQKHKDRRLKQKLFSSVA